MRVEELSRYGESFMEPPKAAALNAFKTMFKTFIGELGFFGTAGLILRCGAESRAVKKEFYSEFKELEEINKGMGKMVSIYVAVFRLLSRKYDREGSFNIMKNVFMNIGRYNMPLIYDADGLLKCEGDLFENFKKLNLSAFKASADTGAVNISLIEEGETFQRIHLDRCDGCKIGGMFGWPEIGKMGCEHDLAGFPEIEDKLGFVFRRHKTIAKGDDVCDFTFYKKGFEPKLDKVLK